MKRIFLIAFIAASFIGCKKSSDNTPAQLDVTVSNLVGVYKVSSIKVPFGGTDVDITTTALPACQLDDTYTLTTGGNVNIADNATVCSPTTTSTAGTYSVNTSAKTITLSNVSTYLNGTATVGSFTSTSLVMTKPVTYMGTTTNATVTFVHP